MPYDLNFNASVAFAFFVILTVLYLLLSKPPQKAPLNIPWLNHVEGEWFSRPRARWRCLRDFRAAISLGYNEYSKKGSSFVLPLLADTTIILPPSTAGWVVNQPDEVLSAEESHLDSLQVDSTFPSPYAIRNPSHHHTVSGDLTRQIGNLTDGMIEEIQEALSEIWGNGQDQWKEVCVWDDVTSIVSRTTNHVFVGKSLSRNTSLLSAALAFATDVPLSANILRLFPVFLRPLVAPVVTLPNKYHDYIFSKIVEPDVKRRFDELSRTSDLEKPARIERGSSAQQNDFLQWTIELALASPNPIDRSPRIIAARMISLNFAAIHTTSVGAVGLIFDLLASDPNARYIDDLREEASTVLASEGGKWSRSAIQKLHKLDSALRESHRMNTFNNLALRRVVMAKEGIITPNGTHCPYRSLIAIPAYGVHNDEDVFPKANEFKPFRFAEMRSELNRDLNLKVHSGHAHTKSQTDIVTDLKIQKANTAFVTTSPAYLAWGHGRHACPGRFFAAAELKMLLATMLLNFEFELIPNQKGVTYDEKTGRPSNTWYGDLIIPPVKARVKVRRRKEQL